MSKTENKGILNALNVVFPDFKAQIELARSQTENEISNLANSVESLSRKLTSDQPLKDAVSDSEESVSSQMKNEYKTRLDLLHAQQASLLDAVTLIGNQFNKLRHFGEDLINIGEQNNALAINIYHMLHDQKEKGLENWDDESTRVPSKMIVRSIQTLRTVEDMNSQLDIAREGMKNVFNLVESISQTQNESFAYMEKLSTRLAAKLDSTLPEEHSQAFDINEIKQDVAAILSSLALQSGVSQIMNSVTTSMSDFVAYINDASVDGVINDTELTTEHLQQMLEANYVSARQARGKTGN